MIFKATNNQTAEFTLVEFDYENFQETTGIKWDFTKEKSETLPIYIGIGIDVWSSSILISEVEKIIDWFEGLLIDREIPSKISVLDNQFYFDLLENNQNSRILRITHDTSLPVPGIGGYSLPLGAKKEDVFKKLSVECKIDDKELEGIIIQLKKELAKPKKRK